MKFSRRNFMAAATLGLAAVVSWTGNFRPWQKKKKTTARFLTKDGKLIELELDRLPFKRHKATKGEVMRWVHPQNQQQS